MGTSVLDASTPKLDSDIPRRLLARMQLIRAYERHVERLFYQGKLTGFHHQSIGAEAVSAGTGLSLRPGDSLISTHRGHGDAIAMGANLEKLLAELHGRSDGCSMGRGGSMHICDRDVGLIGVTAIVGGNLPIAAGLAFAAQYRDSGAVSVAVFGDGASNTGSFHESLNIAAVWKLPVIFVCNNNGYAESTPRAHHQAVKRIAVRARAYAMPGVSVNGTDVFAVYEAVGSAVTRAREGAGPTLVECVAPRWVGHYIGDPGTYMPEATRRQARQRDPLIASRSKAVAQGWLRESDFAELEREAEARVLLAQAAVETSTPVEVSAALGGISASYLGVIDDPEIFSEKTHGAS